MLKIADFLLRLNEDDHPALVNAIGSGLHDARLAAQSLSDPDRHTQGVIQLLAYLSGAITQLEAARAIVRRELEGEAGG